MTDPIDHYAADLTAALHGPARAKARLIEEIHNGLRDTAEAYTAEGIAYEDAVRQAVQEFGTVNELVPGCQRELTVAQARHTARAAACTAPLLTACWYLTTRTTTTGQSWQLSYTAQLLAGLATVATLLAIAMLSATGPLARRLPTPQRLPQAIAWAGTTASISMAVATLTLAIAAALATNWLLLALAGALAAASHATVAPSARACRRCAGRVTYDVQPVASS